MSDDTWEFDVADRAFRRWQHQQRMETPQEYWHTLRLSRDEYLTALREANDTATEMNDDDA